MLPSWAHCPVAAALLAASCLIWASVFLHTEAPFANWAHFQGRATALPSLMPRHSGTLSTGYTVPCSDHAPLSPWFLRPSQLALLCVDQCVSTLVSLLGRLAGSQCRKIVPADTGDACEPANSCMLFACRLGGIFCPNSCNCTSVRWVRAKRALLTPSRRST